MDDGNAAGQQTRVVASWRRRWPSSLGGDEFPRVLFARTLCRLACSPCPDASPPLVLRRLWYCPASPPPGAGPPHMIVRRDHHKQRWGRPSNSALTFLDVRVVTAATVITLCSHPAGTHPGMSGRNTEDRTVPGWANHFRRAVSAPPPHRAAADHRGRRQPQSRTSPACAGRTHGQVTVQISSAGPAPLARGEPRPAGLPTRGGGTSPARAGKLHARGACDVSLGASPARAGKTGREGYENGRREGPAPLARETMRFSCDPSTERDQPCSRGENIMVMIDECHKAGPAPLARGERLLLSAQCRGVRTSPARAGRTKRSKRPRRGPGDQPRSRGENQLAVSLR